MKKKRSNRKKRKTGNRFKAILLIFGSVSLTALAVAAGLHLEQNTRITAVEFSGNYFTEDETLHDAIESPVGILADSIDYPVLFASLESLPYVKDVNLSMGMRGTLTFDISEREPLALLVQDSGKIYVTEEGIKLPVVPGKIRDVPLLYGFPVEPQADTLKSDAYREVEAFLTEARKNEFGWATISEVAWNNRHGVVALSYENGVKLIFGQKGFSKKLRNWEAFYAEVVTKRGIEAFEQIDLRFRNQIVTQES